MTARRSSKKKIFDAAHELLRLLWQTIAPSPCTRSPQSPPVSFGLIEIPATEAGRREWIKVNLRLAGYTLGGLARELGLERSAAKTALWRPYPKMERAIADKLGVKPEQIWPERYVSSRQKRGEP